MCSRSHYKNMEWKNHGMFSFVNCDVSYRTILRFSPPLPHISHFTCVCVCVCKCLLFIRVVNYKSKFVHTHLIKLSSHLILCWSENGVRWLTEISIYLCKYVPLSLENKNAKFSWIAFLQILLLFDFIIHETGQWLTEQSLMVAYRMDQKT